MEFKEYSNPLEKDYDINSSFNNANNENNHISNPYVNILVDIIGILEDIDDEQLMAMYGITTNEYFNPTKETILKVKAHIEKNENIEHKFKM